MKHGERVMPGTTEEVLNNHRHLWGPLTPSSAQLLTEGWANLYKFQLELIPQAVLCDPEMEGTSLIYIQK